MCVGSLIWSNRSGRAAGMRHSKLACLIPAALPDLWSSIGQSRPPEAEWFIREQALAFIGCSTSLFVFFMLLRQFYAIMSQRMRTLIWVDFKGRVGHLFYYRFVVLVEIIFTSALIFFYGVAPFIYNYHFSIFHFENVLELLK